MAASRILAVVFVTLMQLSYTSADRGESRETSSLRRSAPATAKAIDSKLADTVRALDTNGNGKVDKSELAAFAKSQGLNSKEVLSEFQELDINKDGALDPTEIGPLFGEIEAEPKAPAEPLSAAAAPVVSEKLDQSKPAEAEAAAATIALPAAAAEGKDLEVAPVSNQVANGMGLDIAALERDAQEQAAGVIAGRLAQRAQILLARSAVDEHKAKAFDVEVRTLRGNATALAHQSSEEARSAARTAASAVSKKAMGKLEKLQTEEHKAAVAADTQRDQAKEAMARVRQAQASLRSS